MSVSVGNEAAKKGLGLRRHCTELSVSVRIGYLERRVMDGLIAQLLASARETDEIQAPSPSREPILSSFDLTGIAEEIRTGKCKNIIVMAGAGISSSSPPATP